MLILALSVTGGQKVKVVLAAATWMNPHMLVLDEPSNYLDRESLGALAEAIKEFGGGVVMISHNSGASLRSPFMSKLLAAPQYGGRWHKLAACIPWSALVWTELDALMSCRPGYEGTERGSLSVVLMELVLPAEFTNALCQEKWLMEAGKLSVTGQSEAAGNVKLEWKPEEETTDAFGEPLLPASYSLTPACLESHVWPAYELFVLCAMCMWMCT